MKYSQITYTMKKILRTPPQANGNAVWMAEKYKNVVFVAILLFGAGLFSACS